MYKATVRLTDEQVLFLDCVTKPFRSRADTIRDLIDSAMRKVDTSDTLGPAKRSEKAGPSSSSSSSKKVFNKTLSLSLEQHKELILDFWSVKGGSKGETAWKLLNTELIKIQDKYGDEVVREQLQLAINGKFKGVTLRNYEHFKPKAAAKEPEHRHPASKVFTAADFETPVTNPILKELNF